MDKRERAKRHVCPDHFSHRLTVSGKLLKGGKDTSVPSILSTLWSHTHTHSQSGWAAYTYTHIYIHLTCKLPHGKQGLSTWLFHPPVAAVWGVMKWVIPNPQAELWVLPRGGKTGWLTLFPPLRGARVVLGNDFILCCWDWCPEDETIRYKKINHSRD